MLFEGNKCKRNDDKGKLKCLCPESFETLLNSVDTAVMSFTKFYYGFTFKSDH